MTTERHSRKDDAGAEREDARHEVHEKVITKLEELLNVERDAIIGALDELARKKRGEQSPEEELAERFGMHISNGGPGIVEITITNGETKRLVKGADLRVTPHQFGLTSHVPNLPYHAVGVLPNCFLSVRIAAEDEATLRVDWTKLYQNAGLWGNMRLVKRVVLAGKVDIAPLRELDAELAMQRNGFVEITGMGLGVDLMGDMSMLRRELSSRPVGPAAAAGARRRAEALRAREQDDLEE